MKTKFLCIGMLLLALTFYSCEENSADEPLIYENKVTDYDRLYEEIVSIESLDEQLIVVNGLSSIEKYNMWQLKLDNFKSNNQLNDNQTQFIDKLKAEISLDLFEDESVRTFFDKNQKESLMKESIQLFGIELGNYLLTKFENVNQTLDKLGYNESLETVKNFDAISSCDCTKDGDCYRLTGLGFDGLAWEYGVCSNDDCYKETVHVFGYTLWESSDNGKCQY